MLCKLKAATLVGIEAIEVDVEVDVTGGMPGFHLVGLPMGAVREGSVRIKAALSNSGYKVGSMRVTVNLAPADVRKEGASFDLPIALGIMASRRLITLEHQDLLLAGELSLDGRVKAIRGALSLAEAARREGLRGLVLPRANASEAALVSDVEIYGVDTLQQAAALLSGAEGLSPGAAQLPMPASSASVDFADVFGQAEGRRAAEAAAAGGHNLMLLGPPGSGKTMIARRVGTILPPLSREEAIETTKIHSVAGLLQGPLVGQRPFRAPHHTCSAGGLVGGGGVPRPGEVSLAHNGVLFLDELPEFQRACLEALRQPVEDGRVTIVRSRQQVTFPASFMLVAAMNPCPCGYRDSAVRTCICGEKESQRYLSRISGPLLDRFDIFVRAEQVEMKTIIEGQPAESSAAIRERVTAARRRQLRRFSRSRIYCNAQMDSRQLRRHVKLSRAARQMLTTYAEAQSLSARAIHRAIKLARTLADLEQSEHLADEHLFLALTMQRARWVR